MSTAVTVYDGIRDPLAFIKDTGKAIYASGMFGCQTESQGVVLAMECAVKKLPPMSISERYHIIHGRLSMRADAMLADFRTKCNGDHDEISRTPERAEIELAIGKKKKRYFLTWEQAQQEPFVYNGKEQEIVDALAAGRPCKLKPKYATPRARMQMLWARVVSDGVRAMAPEIVAGYYTPEEIDDLPVIDVESRPVQREPEPDIQELMVKAAGGSVQSQPTSGTQPDAPAGPASVKEPFVGPAVDTTTEQSAPPPVSSFDPQQEHSLERIGQPAIDALKLQFKLAGLTAAEAKALIPQFAGPGGGLKDLTPEGAHALAEHLHAIQTAKANVTAAPAAQPPAAAAPTAKPTNGTITPNQVSQIWSVAGDLDKLQPGYKADFQTKLMSKLKGRPLGSISREAGEQILQGLYAESRKLEMARAKGGPSGK